MYAEGYVRQVGGKWYILGGKWEVIGVSVKSVESP